MTKQTKLKTKQFINHNLQKLAAEDFEEAFKILETEAEAGKHWARKLYNEIAPGYLRKKIGEEKKARDYPNEYQVLMKEELNK